MNIVTIKNKLITIIVEPVQCKVVVNDKIIEQVMEHY